MEVQLSTVQSSDSDGVANLISARIKISGMLHSLANAPKASYGLNTQRGANVSESDKFFMASSSINWNGGDTGLQVPSLDNINADILHQWEQSLAIKPSVLTTDLTLVPIYELVENENKRLTLRSALDDLLTGNLKANSNHKMGNHKMLQEHLDEITARVQEEVLERHRGGSIKTRKAAVELSKPPTRCCIL